MIFNKQISVYIILYFDLDFLHDIISKIYDYVDEIIIVDGPYKYCIEVLNQLNLLYNEDSKPDELKRIINDYSKKVKYYYNVWENEKEKRIFGYSKCTNEFILLIDGDEFFVLNIDNIINFIKSDKKVGGFLIYNMNRIDITFNNLNIICKKFVLFKKDYIKPLQHLSYLWLVGVDSLEEKNIYIMYNEYSLGYIYHLTLNRTKKNNIIKYIFYKSLYFYIKNEPINIINNFNIKNKIETIGISNVLDIFYHSDLPLIGIPYNEKLNKIKLENIDLSLYNNNHIDAYFNNTFSGSKYIQTYFYITFKNDKEINITFKNVKEINITLYQISLNREYNIQIKNNNIIENNKHVFNYDYDKPDLCCVILFNCFKTIDDSDIYEIISID